MLIQMQYKNHINETVDFGSGGIYVNASDLRDYEWDISTRGNRVSALSRGVATRTIPVVIYCSTAEEAVAAKNKLLEVAEKDVLAMQPGKLIVGGYYYRCYVTQSRKSTYARNPRYLEAELTVTSDKPVWIKETLYSFNAAQAGAQADFLDYPHDYPHDYTSSYAVQELPNSGFVGTNFRIDVFGACTNPAVTINGHVYQVNAALLAGEYLTIDSAQKTVIKTAQDGTKTNLFNFRNKESYIFEQIPPGSNPVTWDGSFDFNVTILEERSEPKWT